MNCIKMSAQPIINYMGAIVSEDEYGEIEIKHYNDTKDYDGYYYCNECDSSGSHPSSFATLTEVDKEIINKELLK